MKKAVVLLTGCLLFGMVNAQQTPGTNTTERAAQKAQNKQSKKFQTDKKYSSVVNSRQAKSAKKQQAKANGKG